MKIKATVISFILLASLSVCAQRSNTPRLPSVSVPVVRPQIVSTLPHDTLAFTQGFLCRGDYLYQSTGIVGRSSLRQIDRHSGEIQQKIDVPGVFGEGIAILGDELVQLTWQEGVAIRYSFPDLENRGTFRYSGEGWGLTSDSQTFILTNGSDTLYLRDQNFSVQKKIPVTLDGKPLRNLNELEYLNGKVYANVFTQAFIAEIDLSSGVVTRIIDCRDLVQREQPLNHEQVLNGVAYCGEQERWYLTGKEWNHIYLVEIP
ncbi:glutaminyl-peptide cyclotransferase [Chitinispirillales bacterium ANBcel5]|uniref:glutaminyl-peptide cyclotransferase n=1 Tax=Cellulosispirillum alkaliphilum TaxID=3039283 RepID=UPI002A558648|nr:glutaminyl-peptide cyclotransferase [Chitinispirillales bacterium ANBcel5]